MKKTLLISLLLIVLTATFVANSVLAKDSGLVQCGKEGNPQQQAEGCNFEAAIDMINRIINYLIMISVPLAAIAFAYAGWLRLSAGDSSEKVTRSNHIFTTVGIGLLVILSGWLVFKYIADSFLSSDYKNSTYLN